MLLWTLKKEKYSWNNIRFDHLFTDCTLYISVTPTQDAIFTTRLISHPKFRQTAVARGVGVPLTESVANRKLLHAQAQGLISNQYRIYIARAPFWKIVAVGRRTTIVTFVRGPMFRPKASAHLISTPYLSRDTVSLSMMLYVRVSVAEPKLFIFGSGSSSDFDHNFGSGSSSSDSHILAL